jgi:short-subunit dehydrogenase
MVSSAAAWFPVPGLTAYGATKAGVEGFVGGLRREVGRRGVLVHSVNPGPVRTEWLPRSAGDRPGDEQDVTRLGPGVPPEWVSRAVEQCLTRTWARTLGVPRAVELARLTVVPGVNRVVDTTLGLVAPQLAAWSRQLARARAGD